MHGYPLPSHVYEDLSEEFDLKKEKLDTLDVIASMFKRDMGKGDGKGEGDKTNLNIFNFFDKLKLDLGETPKQKFQRVVRKNFVKTP